jgi:hypothetical protein
MKKLLTLLFTFAILYSPYSHSNILDNLLGNMSTSDVRLYDTSWTELSNGNIKFKGKLKNINPDKKIKEVLIKIKTLDCNKGCKNCIEADVGNYRALNKEDKDDPFQDIFPSETVIIRPHNTFQVSIVIGDETKKGTYVQARGNETCFNYSVNKVSGFHIFE